MSCAPLWPSTIDLNLAYDWAYEACVVAERVPAAGEEAVNWTVRGWAEVALGCVVADAAEAFHALDDAIRRSAVPCRGPFAGRLRTLRSRFGAPPAWYFADEPANLGRPPELDAQTTQACLLLAEFCDSLIDAVAARRRGRSGRESGPPLWTNTSDHLRWGQRLRPRSSDYPYSVLSTTVERRLTWRTWLIMPTIKGPQIVLVDPQQITSSARVRQRVCHGIHNGAHLDHLGALVATAQTVQWTRPPIEFGDGLLVAESFAMAVELLAATQCLLAGLAAEARELAGGFAQRIGRLPGYRAWYEAEGRKRGSATLDAAALVAIREFDTLPILAANYVTGPLRLLAADHHDPLLPPALYGQLRRRWDDVAVRFPTAARMIRRARDLA